MACRDLPGQRGFTLIEVMIALSILGLVLTSVLKLHGQSLGLLERASAEVQVPWLASEIMSRVICGLPETEVVSGEFENFPEFSWEAGVEPVEDAGISEENPRLFRVKVRILRRGLVFFTQETLHGVLP